MLFRYFVYDFSVVSLVTNDTGVFSLLRFTILVFFISIVSSLYYYYYYYYYYYHQQQHCPMIFHLRIWSSDIHFLKLLFSDFPSNFVSWIPAQCIIPNSRQADGCAYVKISHTAVTNSYCSIKERVKYLLTPPFRGLRSFIALRLSSSSSSVHSSESRWSQSKNVVVKRVSLHVILFLSPLCFVSSVHL
jgi:hypothetical protein